MSAIDSSQFPKMIPGLERLPQALFLIGDEEALLSECLKTLRESFLKRHGEVMIEFNQDVFYGEKDEGGRILDACSTLPVGMDRRLVILHQAEKISSSTEEELMDYLADPNPSTVLVILWDRQENP